MKQFCQTLAEDIVTNVLHFPKSIKTKQSDNSTSRESSSDQDEYPLRDEVHDRHLMAITAKGITDQTHGLSYW